MKATVLKNPPEGHENRFSGNYEDEKIPITKKAVSELYNGKSNSFFIDGNWIEIGEEFTKKPKVPEEISRMKFKIQIRRSTIYSYDIILEYLKNLALNKTFSQDDKDELIDRLEDAVSFNRYHKDFINLANMLGVSDAIKDEIFVEGNKIE
ncbi:hypothetical protein [Flavobacterium facile]|uniref:hypothetical protein n=1 Tax=Flavobacterium facile TaxID=2893174 RepID=UPI002E77928B|nr:hypothetical protein [Flavobacterium sp. T-12]